MKTLFTLLIAMLAIGSVDAQRSTESTSTDGLELLSSPRNNRHDYYLSRMNYWTSRYDRHWSKWEKFASTDFIEKITRSTRNLSRMSNRWRVDQYPTKNKSEHRRKEGLNKIN
jgi:hypothetical protein